MALTSANLDTGQRCPGAEPSSARGADAGTVTGLGGCDGHRDEEGTTFVDTVVVGTGPSALILSYILNGRHPYIGKDVSHPDPQLQAKLAHITSLFEADFWHLSAHFLASRYSYSTQALPVNTLLDTLLRPLGDTAPGLYESCIEWRQTDQKVDHVVLGSDIEAGGQWHGNPVACSWDIGALSYADLLTLPEYTMAAHMHEHGKTDVDTGFLRPTRREVADYLSVWPQKVGIQDSLNLGKHVDGIERTADGQFYISSHQIRCRRLVLASGIFTHLIPPRELLRPLAKLQPPSPPSSDDLPLLVIGSGFSAADVILTSLPKGRRVLHIFKWDTNDIASPLRACHPSAYPEYAGVFRRMRRAASEALGQPGSPDLRREMKRRQSSTVGAEAAEFDQFYEGLPNTWIHTIKISPDGTRASLILERPGGGLMERDVCGLQYVIGRRGSPEYIERAIRAEVLGESVAPAVIDAGAPISARNLRRKAEISDTLEMAPNVFAIGSLLGDSLVRHAYGGCVVVARELLGKRVAEGDGSVGLEETNSIRHDGGENETLNGVSKFAHHPIASEQSSTFVVESNSHNLSESHEREHEHLDDLKRGPRTTRSAWCDCGLDHELHLQSEELACC